jgi:hypothetical protein
MVIHMRLVERTETPIMFVAVKDGSEEIGRGWDHLESVLGSMQRRRFIGAFDDDGVYRCGVQIRDGDDPGGLGLHSGVIPGGSFLCATVRGPQPAAYALLAPTFDALQRSADQDPTRPSLEYYRRHDQIDVLMPV